MAARVRYKSNRPVVIKAGQDAAQRIGMRFGGLVRTIARRSIKKPTKKNPEPSRPGEPPKDVSGALRSNILFAWEPETRTVLIGPRILPGRTKGAPGALEAGGDVQAKVLVGEGKQRHRETQTVHIAERPFMRPALAKALPELPSMWRNAIRT